MGGGLAKRLIFDEADINTLRELYGPPPYAFCASQCSARGDDVALPQI